MVNKDGQYGVKLPTQYRTKKEYNKPTKVLKKEGDKYNYQKRIKCPVCGKRSIEKYETRYPELVVTQIKSCKNCNYINMMKL